MPRLLVKLPGGTKTVPLGDEALTIGRTNENTVPVDDVGVSRRHAQILFVGKGYEIVDMGSRNGTKVNGQKVPRAILKQGDVIGIGGVDMVFEEQSAGPSGGLELEELDLGGAASSAPAPGAAAPTGAFRADTGAPAGECLLRIVAGEKQGTDIPLKGPRTTFGRRPGNTVSFNDNAVSGVHCEITREANGYVLRDLGSTNGTLVDGEPVVETMLRHNARVKIGAQRAIFVDPTVADIESSLASDDAAEWGLMKGEIDPTALRSRGGKGGLIAAGIVVVAAAGGAWFAMQASPGGAIVEPVKDNRIQDHSFEDGVVRWFAPGEDGGARARIVGGQESPRGASGVSSLEVLPQGDGVGIVEYSAAAAGSGDATVSADTAYEISARVGSGRGAVVVTWVSASRPGLQREDASPPVSGSATWSETKAIVVAPAHASAARVGLAAFGGAAVFDDVVFRRAEAAKPAAFVAGDLQVRIDASGCVEAVRGGMDVLLTEGGLAAAAETPPEELLGSSVAAPPALDGAALSARATLAGGTAFAVKVQPAAGGAAISCTPEGGPGAFTFSCPMGAVRGAVTLVLDKTALVLPEAESFTQTGVRKVIVGSADGPAPFVLSADPASPGFTLSSRRSARGLRIQLAPPASPPQGVDATTVFLSVDLSREDQAAQALMQKAEEMAREGRKGAAADAYERVALEHHYLPKFRDPASAALAKIREEAGARLKEAKRLAAEGKEFASIPDLEGAVQAGESLAREFADGPVGVEGKALAEAARGVLKTVRAGTLEDRVGKVFLRAVDYESNRQPVLALLLYEEILRVAPEDDDRRPRAEEKVKALRGEMKSALDALYGSAK